MDGSLFGKLLVDIILAYFIGKSTWNKTQSSGKTTVVVIIALISPLIAWIVSSFFSPAEPSAFQVSINNNDETKAKIGETLETDNLIDKNEIVEEEKVNEEKSRYVFTFDNNSNKTFDNSIVTYKDGTHNEVDSKITKVKFEPVMLKDDKPIEFCRFCGAKLNEGAEFCHKCGTKVG